MDKKYKIELSVVYFIVIGDELYISKLDERKCNFKNL